MRVGVFSVNRALAPAGWLRAVHKLETHRQGFRCQGWRGSGAIMVAGGPFMTRPPFEILEHTADAGIVAHGQSLEELFANAAAGMFSLMADLGGVRQAEEREIDIEARDREALLVRWLTELLYYLDAEEMLFSRFDVHEATDTRLRAHAFGERIDPRRHRPPFGGEGGPRHMLEGAPEDGGYRAQVLFDI